MMNPGFLSTISVLISFICLILAIFLFMAKSERQFSNRLFAGFLTLLAIDVSGWMIASTYLAGSWLDALRFIIVFLQMPFFVGFIAATCFSDMRITARDALHGLPFLFALILILPGNQLTFIGNGNDPISKTFLTTHEMRVIYISLNIQYYLYMATAVIILYRFRKIFLQYYTDVRSKTFVWLSQLVVISLLANTLAQVKSFAAISGWTQTLSHLQIAVSLVILTIVTWFTFKALLQPELFRSIDKTLMRVATLTRQHSLAGNDRQSPNAETTRLRTHMDYAKPYLDSTLTLPSLAQQLNVPTHELSELINRDLGVNFFDFVNDYRIIRAQEILRTDHTKTVLEILYEVGFNSKSSFNTAFRKYTGTTPTSYRKANSASKPGTE